MTDEKFVTVLLTLFSTVWHGFMAFCIYAGWDWVVYTMIVFMVLNSYAWIVSD